LQKPATLLELAEDDEVAPVGRHHLPVAATQRPVGPPAVLDEPRLAHGLDGAPGDVERAPTIPNAHAHG
jgi:hypothetical protein